MKKLNSFDFRNNQYYGFDTDKHMHFKQDLGELISDEQWNREVNKYIENMLIKEPYRLGIPELDDITTKMWSNILTIGRLFLKKIINTAPIIINFHQDGDGLSGAMSIYTSLKSMFSSYPIDNLITWLPHKGVNLEQSDIELGSSIASNVSSIEKPLFVIIDFGTTKESNNVINNALEKFDIIWIDHHKIDEFNIPNNYYINPLLFGGKSDYTAGALANVVMHAFSHVDNKELAYISLIADSSIYAPKDKNLLFESQIYDLIAIYPKIVGSSFVTPKIILNLDEYEKKEIYAYSNKRYEELEERAFKIIKKIESNKANLFILDFEKIKDNDPYPPSGKFASYIFWKLESISKKPIILILLTKKFSSVRVSKTIEDIANNIIKNIKEKGILIGGHNLAFSVDNSDEKKKEEIISVIKSAI